MYYIVAVLLHIVVVSVLHTVLLAALSYNHHIAAAEEVLAAWEEAVGKETADKEKVLAGMVVVYVTEIVVEDMNLECSRIVAGLLARRRMLQLLAGPLPSCLRAGQSQALSWRGKWGWGELTPIVSDSVAVIVRLKS